MNEQEALAKMVPPGQRRPGKLGGFGGVVQILVTSSCDKSCFNCTQGSNFARPKWFMAPDQFEAAVRSLDGYFGVVGVFGGNPALSPHFGAYCNVLHKHVPPERRGLWCNHPITPHNARTMRRTFNPAVSNLNVHLDAAAFAMFKEGWPECRPFGLNEDSRHSPPWVAMRDVLRKPCPDCNDESGYRIHCGTCEGGGKAGQVYDEDRAWELISGCDVNQHWSAGIGVFRGELRAWFCELAMAQSVLHQDEADYPDTGLDPTVGFSGFGGHRGPREESAWWELPMNAFARQVKKHCHECGVPLRGYGELAQASDEGSDAAEEVSWLHASVARPKRPGRRVEKVKELVQLDVGKIRSSVAYLQNARV
jgi:hypothetical protein